MTIPEGVTAIGKYAFFDCRNLEAIYFNATAMNDLTSTTCAFDGAGADGDGIKLVIGKNVTKIPAYLFATSSIAAKITSVEFEEGSVCQSIGDSAFINNKSLSSIVIPNSVTKIGVGAFSSCIGLTSVEIGSGVSVIGDSAFYYCTGLTDLKIGSGVTEIGHNAFAYCKSLASVVIPASVTLIKTNAFADCRSLTSMTFEYASWEYASYAGGRAEYKYLSNASEAARYLTSTYASKYWSKR